MADVIHPADRALIDAHIERYGVTRIEAGVSGLDPDASTRPWSEGWARRRTAAVQKRRDKVCRHVLAGHSIKSLALKFRVSVPTISDDVRALKAEGRLPAHNIRRGRPGGRVRA